MSAFRLFLLNLLDPGRLGHGEKFLQLLKYTGDHRFGFEGFELVRKGVGFASEAEDAPLDRRDIVFGEPFLPGFRGDVEIQPGKHRLVEDRVEFVRCFRDHPAFLRFVFGVLRCAHA